MADAMGFKFTYSFDHGVHYGSPNRSSEMIISTEEAHAAAMLEQAFQTKCVAEAIDRLADAANRIAEKTSDSGSSSAIGYLADEVFKGLDSIAGSIDTATGKQTGSGVLDPEIEGALRAIDEMDRKMAESRADDGEKPES